MAVVMITGTSAGLGRETSLALARRGHKVYATMRRPQPLAAGVEVLALDVTKPESIARAVETVVAKAGCLDVVINNAGVGVASSPVEELTDEALHAAFETNVVGVLNMVRVVAPVLRTARSGHIINVGSVSGRMSRPFGGAYAASKHALVALSDALYWELRPHGVHVTMFEPGFLATDIHKHHVNVERSASSPYATDEASFNRALGELLRRADAPNLAAEALANIVDASERKRRAVFGAGAQRLVAIAEALSDDTTSASYVEAIQRHQHTERT